MRPGIAEPGDILRMKKFADGRYGLAACKGTQPLELPQGIQVTLTDFSRSFRVVNNLEGSHCDGFVRDGWIVFVQNDARATLIRGLPLNTKVYVTSMRTVSQQMSVLEQFDLAA